MEIVLGVKREQISGLLRKDFGYIRSDDFSFIEANLEERLRNSAEADFSFKQVIPYLYIRSNELFLLYRRTKQQSESRLHEKLSIGIGGHINPNDRTGKGAIYNCLLRELSEEVSLPDIDMSSLRFLGYINDDISDVGKVHIGLVFEVQSSMPSHKVNEVGKLECEWVDIDYLNANDPLLESWSQIILRELLSN